MPNRLRNFALCLSGLAAFVYPLAHPFDNLGHDWDYFASLSWVTLSNWLGNHSFHDPWACGGLDLLANPQARVWSPLGALDVLLPPHQAHALSWAIYGLIGVFGAYHACRSFAADKMSSLVASTVFIHSSYFSLHYVEGHSTFAALQALPWFVHWGRTLHNPRAQAGAIALCALFVADGAFYALVFASYLVITILIISPPRRVRPTRAGMWALLGFSLVLAAKLIPVLLLGGRTDSQCTTDTTPWIDALRAFFDPRVETHGFHELGCYVGTAAVCMGLGRSWRLIAAAGFWTWTALGLGGPLNPWRLHCALPLVNVAHVQSRTLVIVVILLMLMIARARPRWLALLFIIEAVVVRNDTYLRAYRAYSGTVLPHAAIAKTEWRETIAYGPKPYIYQAEGVTSRTCYEPSFTTPIVEVGAPGAEIAKLVPGEIVLRHQPGGEITLNTAHLGGWSGAPLLSRPGERLRIVAPAGEVVLRYQPGYRPWIWVCVLLAYLSIPFSLRAMRGRARDITRHIKGTKRTSATLSESTSPLLSLTATTSSCSSLPTGITKRPRGAS